MKTTRSLKILSRILFFFGVFFIVVFFSDWFSGPFFFNRNYWVLKFILCVIVPLLTVLFNFIQEKKLRFISKTAPIIMSSFICFFLLFNFLSIEQFRFYQMASLYHIAYALVCIFSVFAVATIIAAHNSGEVGYSEFYNDFFLGYLPVLIMLYILFYINYRELGGEYEVNLIPFGGEIKKLFLMPSAFHIMRTIGNIAFYSTITLTAARFIKKNTAAYAFLVGFLLCAVTEFAQGILSVGDADIDDIILNSTGALIGALIYKLIIEKIIKRAAIQD